MFHTTGIACVDGFLRRLGRLTPTEWMAVGRLEDALAATTLDRRTAEFLAETIVAHRRLHVVRWYALDAVDTWASLATSDDDARSARARALMSLARRAARRAAVAVIARQDLTRSDFALLYAPVQAMLARHPTRMR